MPVWWHDAVIYQIYPRSFADADGDGVGDLRGITSRLDHVAALGADAIWLSPIYPSPNADFGYDISDHADVDPLYGRLADLDALVAACHARDLRLLLDLVPSHTSIEHPWFRQHPERYTWHDGPVPPNNWRATFGGPAWSRDDETGRWYLHSYFPEQPDLDWRDPDVVAAMDGVVRFWLGRGVDGFRVDAATRLAKDPLLRDDPLRTGPCPWPWHPEYAALDHVHSKNFPDIGVPLAALRAAAGDALLVGEATLPTPELAPYVEHLDLCFCFELQFGPWAGGGVRAAVDRALALGRMAWVLSNHDAPRLATRLGPERAGAAAVLLLTLPGPAFVYQGDELGLSDGPGGNPPFDRAGRDGARHPLCWERGPGGGFTRGIPWLPVAEPSAWAGGTAAEQAGRPGSMLELHRELIALRRLINGELRWRSSEDQTLVYTRGEDWIVCLDLDGGPAPQPAELGEVVLRTPRGDGVVGRVG